LRISLPKRCSRDEREGRNEAKDERPNSVSSYSNETLSEGETHRARVDHSDDW